MPEAYWKAQENRIKKFLEKRGWTAWRQPGSGNLPQTQLKGDVRAMFGNFTRLLIDHKSTRGEKSVAIKREDLQKITVQAADVEAWPAVTFGYKGKHDLYAVVPLDVFLDLLEIQDRHISHLESTYD